MTDKEFLDNQFLEKDNGLSKSSKQVKLGGKLTSSVDYIPAESGHSIRWISKYAHYHSLYE